MIYVNIHMVKSVYSSLQVVNNQAPLDLILWQINDIKCVGPDLDQNCLTLSVCS